MSHDTIGNNSLLVRWVKPNLEEAFDIAQYTQEIFNLDGLHRVIVNQKCFDDFHKSQLLELFGCNIHTQSIITIVLPKGDEYYLTSSDYNRCPLVAGVFGDLIVVQLQSQVFCLSVENLEIIHTFTLSRKLRFYGDVAVHGDDIVVTYTSGTSPELAIETEVFSFA